MNSVYKANLLLRISTFHQDLASVDVDHTKIIYMKACCGNAHAGPVLVRINFCKCTLVAVAALGTGEFMLKSKPCDFFETAQRLPFGGHVQIGMMEPTTLEDLAADWLKRFEARGGEILVPTSVKLAKCHYKEVLLDQPLDTRVDTEVVIADCGEERVAHPAASPVEDNDSGDVSWSSGVLPKKRTQGRRASLAGFAWLAREPCNGSQ